MNDPDDDMPKDTEKKAKGSAAEPSEMQKLFYTSRIEKSEGKSEEKYIEKSEYILNGTRYEEAYDSANRTAYFIGCSIKDDTLVFTRKSKLILGNLTIHPILDDLLQKEFVVLPTQPTEYGSISELDERIKQFVNNWCGVSEGHLKIVPSFVRLTWVIDVLFSTPYLKVLAPYGQGKSRYLDTIGGLCRKAMFVGGAVKSAPIFRTIDTWRGTLVLDEFNLEKSEDTQAIMQILNQGIERKKAVLRCKDGDYSKVEAFDSFGPKVIASKKINRDEAFESRCITEIMHETTKKPVLLTKEFYAERLALQNQLLMYRFRNLGKIDSERLNRFDFGQINPRIRQVYSPLLLAYPEGDPMEAELVKIMEARSDEIRTDDTEGMDGIVFNMYEELRSFDDGGVITAAAICQGIKASDPVTYEKLTPIGVGRILAPLGFKKTVKKIDGKTVRLVTIDADTRMMLRSKYVVD